ncbi:kininogen-1 isoform X2 [Trichomycterus rosablanca]|uniref:kininogen-1 isoform X2 n=1 Tax=Trichomycterus rosablanca TaxID=2290929 RepID=UPI002F358A35
MRQHGIWVILASAWLLCSGARGDEEKNLQCDEKSVEDLVASALTAHNKELTDGAQLALYQVLEATKVKNETVKTVTVHFTARESDCAAGSEKPWQECDYLQNSTKVLRHCHVKAVMEETAEIFSLLCSVDPPVARGVPPPCLGCPEKIDLESEDIMDPLSYSVNKANMMEDYNHHFLLNSIAWVTRQVIAGFRYRLQFDMQKSNCSKADFKELTDDCHPDKENQEFINCNSTVDVAPWRHEQPETNVQCAPGPLMLTVIRRRPPGWSPLRNLQSFVVKEKKKDSSEECQEGKTSSCEKPNAASTIDQSPEQSATPDAGTATPDTGTATPDAGTATPDAGTATPLNCPSKPWKEFNPPPPAPSAPRAPPPPPRPLSDLDLADLVPPV